MNANRREWEGKKRKAHSKASIILILNSLQSKMHRIFCGTSATNTVPTRQVCRTALMRFLRKADKGGRPPKGWIPYMKLSEQQALASQQEKPRSLCHLDRARTRSERHLRQHCPCGSGANDEKRGKFVALFPIICSTGTSPAGASQAQTGTQTLSEHHQGSRLRGGG